MKVSTHVSALRQFILLSAFSFCTFLGAQSVDTVIVDQTPQGRRALDDALIEKLQVMIKDQRLMEWKDCKKQLSANQPKAVSLPAVKTTPLNSEELAQIAREAHVRVGFVYLCEKCDHWHLSLSGGYAISANQVATCNHVVDSGNAMREGYLVVIDAKDQIYPVKAINARSVKMDAAIVEVEGGELQALPLQSDIKQGAAVYCYSDPMGQVGYFSDGIINRFFWIRTPKNSIEEKFSMHQLRFLRFNCSTDWAPGSSGSAVLDAYGNAIGHVSEIASLSKQKGGDAFVTLHRGIPAKSVRALAEAMVNPEDIAQLNAMEAKENRGTNQKSAGTKE
jgi:S1-C subfamily serine protease